MLKRLGLAFLAMGLWVSSVIALDWESLNGPYGGSVRQFAAGQNGTLYVSTNEAGVFRSDDDGANWTATVLPGPDQAPIVTAPSGRVFVSSEVQNQLYYSDDLMVTLIPINKPNGWIQHLYAFNNTTVLAYGYDFDYNEVAIWRTTNLNTWSVVLFPGQQADGAHLTPFGDNGVIAGFREGALPQYSTDAGASWEEFGDPGVGWGVDFYLITASGTVIASDNGTLYRSTDNGQTYVASLTLNDSIIHTGTISFNGDLYGFTNTNQIVRSTNDGITWNVLAHNFPTAETVYCTVATENRLLIGAVGGVYASANGVDWTPSVHGITAADNRHLAVSPGGLVLTERGYPGVGLWIYYDGGWAADASVNVPITTSSHGHIYASGTTHVYRASDNNHTFQQRGAYPDGQAFQHLFTAPNGDLFGSVGGWNNEALYRSIDGGSTFTLVGNIWVTDMEFRGATGYAASPGSGVYKTVNSGATWVRIIEDAGVPRIAVGPEGQVYMSKYGLYRSDDGGFSWTDIGVNLYGSLSQPVSVDVWLLDTDAGGGIYCDLNWVLENGQYGSGFYVSWDEGMTWELAADWRARTAVKGADGLFYASGTRGIVRSEGSAGNDDEPVIENPHGFELLRNYPNPFNATTVVTFTLPQPDWITLNVYDIIGRKITQLAEGNWQAGAHSLVFSSDQLPSGVYYCSLKGRSGVSATSRMMLLK